MINFFNTNFFNKLDFNQNTIKLENLLKETFDQIPLNYKKKQEIDLNSFSKELKIVYEIEKKEYEKDENELKDKKQILETQIKILSSNKNYEFNIIYTGENKFKFNSEKQIFTPKYFLENLTKCKNKKTSKFIIDNYFLFLENLNLQTNYKKTLNLNEKLKLKYKMPLLKK